MTMQFESLTRAALAATWLLMPALAHAQMGGTSDPIDGARALLGRTPAVAPAAMPHDASAVDPRFPSGERALVAKFSRPNDRQSSVSSLAARVGSISERALLGR